MPASLLISLKTGQSTCVNISIAQLNTKDSVDNITKALALALKCNLLQMQASCLIMWREDTGD